MGWPKDEFKLLMELEHLAKPAFILGRLTVGALRLAKTIHLVGVVKNKHIPSFLCFCQPRKRSNGAAWR